MSLAAMPIESAPDAALRQTLPRVFEIVVLMLDDRAHQAAEGSDILAVADPLDGFQAAPGRHGIDVGTVVFLYATSKTAPVWIALSSKRSS